MLIDGPYPSESAGPGPEVLKVALLTGAAYSYHPMAIFGVSPKNESDITHDNISFVIKELNEPEY